MENVKLNPPILDNKIIAQTNSTSLSIPFLMNKSVGLGDFDFIALDIKTVQSNTSLLEKPFLYCLKKFLFFEKGSYWGTFANDKDSLFKIGQHYKIQLAYGKGDPNGEYHIGFWSTVATFKFTYAPRVSIQNLALDKPNTHIYNYTGVYSNDDASEKIYSYEFFLHDSANNLIATSGEKLHNSSFDTESTESIDQWSMKSGLTSNKEYLISYKIKTINGIEKTSPAYRLRDNSATRSEIFNYCKFTATNILDSACVELSLDPILDNQIERKLINGQFVLLRSSNEDNFSSWQELTRFAISSHNTAQRKVICRDYCVSQGVQYQYALQAFNNNGMYSLRECTSKFLVDFEDMFLSDGDRQLKIKFNPKVSSFKTTLLEQKMDTLGGKYPFFVRNGNVRYKEFPISGLISMLSDTDEEFMTGIKDISLQRTTTPANQKLLIPELSTQLTGENFQKERTFKLEVLDWLTNGKPKLFKSPGEGNYIVRLLNTSLSPNDALGRMLHTFTSTACEVADYNFENLRKYGIMMDEYLETRELRIESIALEAIEGGYLNNLNACSATINATPGTKFAYRLKNDTDASGVIEVGNTGVFSFSNSVLADNPLMEIGPVAGSSINPWLPEATLIYARYINPKLDNFSYLHSIKTTDRIYQWIGQNRSEVAHRFDKYRILYDIGMIYYLNVSKRPIIASITTVDPRGDGTYRFYEKSVEYKPANNELLYCTEDGNYYDGLTKKKIGKKIDFSFQLRNIDQKIDMMGTNISTDIGEILGCDAITTTGGRLVLTNIGPVDLLWIGNGLYVDIAYQEIEKIYTAETIAGSDIAIAKANYLKSGSTSDWNIYYELLAAYVEDQEEKIYVNAL